MARASAHDRFWALGIASRVYGEAGRLDESDALVRELHALLRSKPDMPVREQAATDRYAALAALRRGDAASALTLASRALTRLEEARGPDREKLPVILILASAANAAGDFESARASALRARELAERRLGDFPHSFHLGVAILELGIAEKGLRQVDHARSALQLAVAHLHDSLGEHARDTKRARDHLAALGA